MGRNGALWGVVGGGAPESHEKPNARDAMEGAVPGDAAASVEVEPGAAR